jgi:tRNA threonylcarbamoyladenosine biosynthesis protein TsaE
VHHVDLYRMVTEEELEDIGLEELIGEEDSVTVIEWPEVAARLLPENSVRISFTYEGENTRRINVKN